jgi:hypothetical protein
MEDKTKDLGENGFFISFIVSIYMSPSTGDFF